jgi:hypothetical protein
VEETVVGPYVEVSATGTRQRSLKGEKEPKSYKKSAITWLKKNDAVSE